MGEPVSAGLEQLQESAEKCMKNRMELFVMHIQSIVCENLEKFEEKRFAVDKWERKEGGGGLTCILQDGKLYCISYYYLALSKVLGPS